MRFREHRKTISLLVSSRAATSLAAMLLTVAAAGCGDDGDGGPDARTPELADVQALFTQTCAGATCHVGFQNEPAAGLDLRNASVCASVINVDAVEVPTIKRVVPGDPDASYLLCKVTPGCDDLPARAQLMPQGSNGLPDAERILISQWIAGGTPGCNTGVDNEAPRFDGVKTVTPQSQAVRLGWEAATDDVTQSDDIKYLVYFAEESGAQDFSAAAAVETAAGELQATVSGLEPGQQYFFVVRASDAAGNIDDNTNEIMGSPLAIVDNVAPTFTGVATATARGATVIELTWTAATDDVSAAAEIKYNVYMAEGTAAPTDFSTPTFITTPGATNTFARGLRAGNAYTFVVRAEDAAGNIDTNTNAVTEETEDDIFFPQDIQPILTANCTDAACHDAAVPAEGLNLTEGNAHASLVSQDAAQCSGAENRDRVEPANPEASYLVDKILGQNLCGVGTLQMPRNGSPLSEDEIAAIRQWIAEGALTDGTPGPN